MRKRTGPIAALALAAFCLASRDGVAQTIVAPFDQDYVADSLGSVPGVPNNYGGLTFLPDDPDTLIIGGAANQPSGQLYAIAVVRDDENHITGFSGTATAYAPAAYNDGGVTFGPGDVLFTARWPVNELGQLEPGSQTTDKIIALTPLGVPSSLSALAFVPAGFPGAGHLKLVTYSGGFWFDSTVVPDGSGTWDLVGVTQKVQIVGGPEGFVYIPPGSPQFEDFTSILVAEYSAGKIVSYEVDSNGDPVVATRVEFLTGLSGAEGAVVDPLTGDFLFSTFGGSSQVVAVRGFGTPNACENSDDCIAFEDACHDGVCNPETDTCESVERENGTTCHDVSPCSVGGQCDDGECVREELLCPTAPGCQDTCDGEAGQCRTCGHPFRNGRCVSNAVFVLQGSLDLRPCELCTCDVDTSGAVAATDALLILRSCAGVAVNLLCAGL